ncbi:BMP/retinoic acid-inducible neural-specific protein 3 [Merluccius polli]|uniref:BMP/retinoic acid-inducible neural-specific protein 3 n=1 Tax=Merluccius polli TaxID=89951 RepID=A0AA47N7K1_MERPO|nr:BMP/retinoic acid-inducible neural-specific protein 3 [Merluccius polli]
MWSLDSAFQWRYEQLENSMRSLLRRAQRVVFKLFSLSKRCQRQPHIHLPRERPRSFWLGHFQSLLYCSENSQLGTFSEELHSCTCRYDHSHWGLQAHGGRLHGELPGFETDLQDLELRYLLQRADRRLGGYWVHAIFISNDMRLNSWFDPSWRKRMLLTLKSNKYKTNMVHMLLGVSLQICLTKNSTLEPALTLYINPFGGSHSESWYIPVNENGFPDWQSAKLDLPSNASTGP